MDKIDYQERYDALVKTIVMAGDLLLCNLFFHLACYYGTVIGQSSVIQSHLLVSSIYFACNIKNGIILHKRKVRKFQIVGIVLRNIFYFSILTTILLKGGHFAMPMPTYYAEYLLAMFVGISCFRLGVRYLIKLYWKRIRHRNGVILWEVRKTM